MDDRAGRLRGGGRASRCIEVGDDHGVTEPLQLACQGVGDSQPVPGDQDVGRQRIFRGCSAPERDFRGDRSEADQLRSRVGQRSQRRGQHRRGRGGQRARQDGGDVVDQIPHRGLRSEQRAGQAADAGPRLLDVSVQLDGHEGIEAQLSREGLRGLERFDGEGADAGDEAEDPPGEVGGIDFQLPVRRGGGCRGRGRGGGLGRARGRGRDCGNGGPHIGGKGHSSLRQCFRLLLHHFRLGLQQRDLFAEQRDQRVHVGSILQWGGRGEGDRLRGRRMPHDRPIGLLLDGRVRKRDQPRLPTFEERQRLDGRAERPEKSDRLREAKKPVVAPAGEPQVRDPLLGRKRGLGEGGERGPGADVQPHASALGGGPPERGDEVDGGGRVVDPDAPDLRRIGGVGRPSDSADHRDLRGVYVDAGDQLAHGAGDSGEERRVEGVRNVERRDLHASRLERRTSAADRLGAPGDDRLLRMIQVRDRRAGDPAKRLADGVRIGSGAGHRARVLELQADHRQPAARNQPQAVLLGENAGRCRGGKLPQAMPQHQVRRDAQVPEDRVHREPDRGHGRLADLRLHEPALRLGTPLGGIEVRAERAAQGGVQVRAERLVEAVEGLAESRDLVVDLAQKPYPLRPLPGEQQHQPAHPLFRPLPFRQIQCKAKRFRRIFVSRYSADQNRNPAAVFPDEFFFIWGKDAVHFNFLPRSGIGAVIFRRCELAPPELSRNQIVPRVTERC